MEKLEYYLTQNKIPNIIFHGATGSGKKTILHQFIQKIYPDKSIREQQVIYVNCAYGKGIKFIREDIKYFSKLNTHSLFKSVILYNAEKLTTDAQFALRRCIEQYNYNTRFFIITLDKYKLIKPILSRFSEIFIYSPINYHSLQLKVFPFKTYETEASKRFNKIMKTLTVDNIQEISNTLYQNAHSVIELEKYVEESDMDTMEKYEWLMYSSKIKSECRNECLLLYILLYFLMFKEKLNLFI